jgi:hypothetical protein
MSSPTYWMLIRLWLMYVGVGVLFGGIIYLMGGQGGMLLALAIFAIFVAIGTIIVSTALWSMLREKQNSQ